MLVTIVTTAMNSTSWKDTLILRRFKVQLMPLTVNILGISATQLLTAIRNIPIIQEHVTKD